MIVLTTLPSSAPACDVPMAGARPRRGDDATHSMSVSPAVPSAAEPDELVFRLYEVIRRQTVTLDGEILCSQSVLFEGNVSLNGYPQEDQRGRPGRCRTQAELLAARNEFHLNMARAIAATMVGDRDHAPAMLQQGHGA